MRTNEARANVLAIAGAPDPVAAAQLYAGSVLTGASAQQCPVAHANVESSNDSGEQSELDILKVAEYGLLVAPITDGIRSFLESPRIVPAFEPHYSYGAIADAVGDKVYTNTLDALGVGGFRSLIEELAAQRAARIENPNYNRMIESFRVTLQAAAMSSAHNMVTDLIANSYTIQAATGNQLTVDELIAATRKSHDLALAHPTSHISDLGNVSYSIQRYSDTLWALKKYPDDILRYDPVSQKAVLAKGIQSWRVAPEDPDSDKLFADKADQNEDVRIGCPFFFAPRELRVGYYEAIVDLIARNCNWPYLSQPPRR